MNLNLIKSAIVGIDEEYIFTKLGKKLRIRNGVGYGFISTPFLYHNRFLEIGFGDIVSGRGDWGGGFEYASQAALDVTIDKDYNIISIDVNSYSNSSSSAEAYPVAKRISKRLKGKLKISDPEIKQLIDRIFERLPLKDHVGIDVFGWGVDRALEHVNGMRRDYYPFLINADKRKANRS